MVGVGLSFVLGEDRSRRLELGPWNENLHAAQPVYCHRIYVAPDGFLEKLRFNALRLPGGF